MRGLVTPTKSSCTPIVALDVPSAKAALDIVERLGDAAGFYKVGLELFTRVGPSFVEELRTRRKRVFLDLKLHDIPNTVAGAVTAACELGVDLLTVHVAGGPAMLAAARNAGKGDTKLLGVTVLTSMLGEELAVAWGRPVDDVPSEVVRLADMVKRSGLDGVVASGSDAPTLRARFGSGLLLVIPGIRLPGTDRGDQRRVATPADAAKAGADYLVIGRAVTKADDPRAALEAVLADIMRSESDTSGAKNR
ncbi:MAG: orotidine-5'-phosphate decarboxylase [Gemmatimonadales bacterium]